MDAQLRRALAARPEVPEAGATRAVALDAGTLPAGYHHADVERCVGQGPAAFDAACECVLTWAMHRGTGIRVTSSDPRAVLGATVVSRIGIGPLSVTAPCRVVWTVDDATRRGFGYTTLPGHPEFGEEAFVVRLDEDGDVWLRVVVFSRPGRWDTRLAGPVVPWLQRLAVRGYGAAVRRAVARDAGVAAQSD